MAIKREYTLNILGRDLTILSEDSPEHIRQIEQLVNERVATMGAGNGVPMHTALMMTVLNLADELLDERRRHGKLKEKIRSRSTVLLEKLDQLNFAA